MESHSQSSHSESIGRLSSDVFERCSSTRSESFSLLICLGTIKFVLLHLNVFALLKKRFFLKFVQNHGSRVQKVHFRLTCVVQKRRCLRFSLKRYRKLNLFTSYEGNFQHHFVCLFLAQRSHRNCARVSHAMAQIFPPNQPHYWKRSEGIQLRSPTPIIANFLAPVVQKLDSAIHRINPYRVDKH